MRALTLSLVFTLCLPAAALAQEVGRIEVVTGKSYLIRKDGSAKHLTAKLPVSLGETLKVDRGNVKVRLNDQSVLMIGQGSSLRIDAAQFEGLVRKKFSATLLLGAVWVRAKKALVGSERNFEIATERAVAGVRGTEFRVDVRTIGKESFTRVSVWEGSVYVRGQVQAPRMSVAMDTDRISSPDAVGESKKMSAKRAPPPSASRSGAASRPSEDILAEESAPAAPPPAAPMAQSAPPPTGGAPAAAKPRSGMNSTERVLDLDQGEAVIVGAGDDWEPDRASKGTDLLTQFVATQKQD